MPCLRPLIHLPFGTALCPTVNRAWGERRADQHVSGSWNREVDLQPPSNGRSDAGKGESFFALSFDIGNTSLFGACCKRGVEIYSRESTDLRPNG